MQVLGNDLKSIAHGIALAITSSWIVEMHLAYF
jgi:hypothetical protein